MMLIIRVAAARPATGAGEFPESSQFGVVRSGARLSWRGVPLDFLFLGGGTFSPSEEDVHAAGFIAVDFGARSHSQAASADFPMPASPVIQSTRRGLASPLASHASTSCMTQSRPVKRGR